MRNLRAKFFVIIGFFVLSSAFVFSQEAESNDVTLTDSSSSETPRLNTFDEQRNAIGLYFLAADDGYAGLQYEHYFTKKIGLTVDGSAVYKSDETESTPIDANVNLQFDISLFEYEAQKVFAYRVYAWFLGGARYKYFSGYSYETKTQNPYWYINAVAGTGFGFEFILVRHISIPIQIGFIGEFPNGGSAGLTFGAGLRYRF